MNPGTDVVGRSPFTWHPDSTAAQILAIGDGGHIFIADVPAATAAAEGLQIVCNASPAQLPTAVRCIQCPRLVTALAFSADGGKLAAVIGHNGVRLACISCCDAVACLVFADAQFNLCFGTSQCFASWARMAVEAYRVYFCKSLLSNQVMCTRAQLDVPLFFVD